VVIDVDGVNWDVNNILFLFEGSEGDKDLSLLVRLEDCLAWLALYFTSVFLWYFPLVLYWDSGFILNCDLLL